MNAEEFMRNLAENVARLGITLEPERKPWDNYQRPLATYPEDPDLAQRRAHIKRHMDAGHKTCEWYLPETGTDSVEELAKMWGLLDEPLQG